MLIPGSAYAAGQCVATYGFKDGKHKGAKKMQPVSEGLGTTMTAQGCLEVCLRERDKRARKGKRLFNKMEYSCTYNNKMINKTSQRIF